VAQRPITARDEQTGRTVTFEWYGDTPPTEQDLAEVFAAAGGEQPTPIASHSAPPPPEEPGMVARFLGNPGSRRIQPQEDLDVDGVLGALKEGLIQGVGQAVAGPLGNMAGRGLKAGARRVYQGLLKPSKGARQQYPKLIETLVEARAPISQGGLRKVEGLMQRSAQQADDLVASHANAAPVRAGEVVREFGDTVKGLRKRIDIGQPSELSKVGARGRGLMRTDRGIGIEIPRAQALKKTAQESANAGYRQAERGAVKEVSADTMLDKDVARGLRKAIEKRIPQIAPVNQRTQQLGGAKDALEDAMSREGNTLAFNGLRDFGAIGGGAAIGAASGSPVLGGGTGLLLKLLSTPAVGSRAAILANDAAKLGIPEGLLRALMASHGAIQE
jgi:hypothetical protein